MQIQPKPTMNINLGKTWQFDRAVAENFLTHAQQHIPDYDRVISKCVRFAEMNLPKHSKILDFGSATGYTIDRLQAAGFTNLYGIDSSSDMIQQCQSKSANYLCADYIPAHYKDFDLILSNWTLQFIENKLEILQQISRSLTDRGYLILSEKVTEDPQLIELYHLWKKGQGVSDQDIALKQQSLAGVLKIKNHRWWLDNLTNAGFNDVQIVNANWCFITYLCKKIISIRRIHV